MGRASPHEPQADGRGDADRTEEPPRDDERAEDRPRPERAGALDREGRRAEKYVPL
jgi:hypothetical protein